MKKILLTLGLLLASASAVATYCTNGATNYPACDNNQPPPPPNPTTVHLGGNSRNTNTNNVGASAGAVAGATSGSQSGANASTGPVNASTGPVNATGTGGRSNSSSSLGDVSNSAGGATVSDNSSTSNRSNMWVFPSPVFTPPLPIATCPSANVDQMAVAGGWNFLSYARGSVNTDNCTAILIYNNMLDHCQYESAHRLLNTLTQKVLPGYQAPQPTNGWLDLSREECAALKAPPKVLPQDLSLLPFTSAGNRMCEASAVAATKTKTKKPATKRKCST